MSFLFTYCAYAQDISGDWKWEQNNIHQTEITFVKINSNEFRGKYCSSYYNGKKIDCYFNENEYSILISKTSSNIFEGTFKSNFSNKSGTLKIEYIPATGKIKVCILTKPDGEYYFPNNVYFEK